MLGVSYLAISQWKAAALRPPSLKAICPWEGFTDAYRDMVQPGGVREDGFIRSFGLALRGAGWLPVHRGATPPPAARRLVARPSPRATRDRVPALICGSFSDNNLHSRGSFRGWERIASADKFLYTHRGGKWPTVLLPEVSAAQLRFFDRYLRGREVPARRGSGSRSGKAATSSGPSGTRELAARRAPNGRALYLTGDGLAGAPPGEGRPAQPSIPGPAAPAGNGPSPPTRSSPGRWRSGSGWRRAGTDDVNLFAGRGEVARAELRRLRGVVRVRQGPDHDRLAQGLAARASTSGAPRPFRAGAGVHQPAAA